MNPSTGPRTPEGKQRSRLNALRHGLTGQTVVLPTEDLQAYKTFCNDFVVHYQPVGPVERQLVQTIADTSWRLNRISAMEHSSLSLAAAEKVDQAGAAGDPRAEACAQALAFSEQSEKIVRLSLYEQRLSRQLERSLKLIKETQADRKQQEKQQPAQAAQKPQVPNQAPAGEFVFSTPASAVFPTTPAPSIATQKDPRKDPRKDETCAMAA